MHWNVVIVCNPRKAVEQAIKASERKLKKSLAAAAKYDLANSPYVLRE
jgi:hypothetical protein